MQLLLRLALVVALGGATVSGLAQRSDALERPDIPHYITQQYDDSRDLELIAKPVAGSNTDIAVVDRLRERIDAAGRVLLRSKSASARQLAFDTLGATLHRRLSEPEGFDLPLEGLAAVSVQSDPGGAWKVYTYQLFVNDSTYRYGGVLHVADRPDQPVRLNDAAQSLRLEREFELTPDQWYGAVYYAVQPFTRTRGREAWLLFGYDADGFYHRRKVVDVLTFDRDGQPRFGAEVFVGREGHPNATASRLILEYRVDARVGVRFDEELGGITFDRLVPGPPVVRGAPPSMVPDGSYDGYIFDEAAGKWVYREEWFDRVVSEEAPRPVPVLDTDEQTTERDLFGRPRATSTRNPR